MLIILSKTQAKFMLQLIFSTNILMVPLLSSESVVKKKINYGSLGGSEG